MSDLENKEAKPILSGMIQHGNPVCLLPRGLASIAAFAFKSAIVSDHVASDRKPFFMPSIRRRFSESLEIPQGVQMWLGAFRSPHAASGFLRTNYAKGRRKGIRGIELYIFTYGNGFFVCQVVACKWIKSRSHPRRFPFFYQPLRWEGFANEFWPNVTDPIIWPPRNHLTSDLVEEFCDRWKTINFFE